MIKIRFPKETDVDEITDEVSFKFNLGSRVVDAITGFVGIVTSRHQWLNGCNTYGVQPEELKDGAPQKNQNFDEPQLKLQDAEVHTPDHRTGGPPKHVERANQL